jgi:hypothetical protein
MLWPPDFYRGVVMTLDGGAGIVTSTCTKLSRQRNGEEHGRFRGMLLPCPCTGPRHMGTNFSKRRPKTQWYIKVGHGRHRDVPLLVGWRRCWLIIYRRSLCVHCGTRHRKYIVLLKYGDQLVSYASFYSLNVWLMASRCLILLSRLKHFLLIISATDGTKFSEEFHALGLFNLLIFFTFVYLLNQRGVNWIFLARTMAVNDVTSMPKSPRSMTTILKLFR